MILLESFERIIQKKYSPYFIFLIISLPSLFLIDEGSFLMHGPQYPLVGTSEIKDFMFSYLSVWRNGTNFDYTTVLFYLHLFLVSIVTGDGYLIQLGYICLCVFISMCGVYSWLNIIGASKFISIFASVLYILNPLAMGGFPLESMSLRNLILLASTPYIFLTIEWFICTENKRKNFYLYLIIFAFISASYSSLQYFVIHLFFIFSYFIFKVYFDNKTNIDIKYLFRYLLIFLLANIYWILPFFFGLQENFASRQEPGISDAEMLINNSYSLLQLAYNLPNRYINEMYPFFNYHYNELFGLKPILIFLAAILGLFVSKDKLRYYLIFLCLLSVLLIQFSFIYYLIFSWVPYLGEMFIRLFRNTSYFYLLTLLPISVLSASGLYFFVSKAKPIYRVIFILVILITYGNGYFMGNMLKSDANMKKSNLFVNQTFKIPNDYLLVAKEIKSDGIKHTILEYPLEIRQTSFLKIREGSDVFFGPSFMHFLTNSNTLSAIRNGEVISSQEKLLSPYYNYENWLNDASKNSIDYVILYKNAICNEGSMCSTYFKYYLDGNPYIRKIIDSDNISLYKLKDSYFSGLIEAKGCLITPDRRHDTLFKSDISKCNSKYTEIILKNNYSDYWKLSEWNERFKNKTINNLLNLIIVNKTFNSTQLNGQNSWIIDTFEFCGISDIDCVNKSSIKIVHTLQRIYIFSLFLSFLIAITLFLYPYFTNNATRTNKAIIK